jgi:hypothetical protein
MSGTIKKSSNTNETEFFNLIGFGQPYYTHRSLNNSNINGRFLGESETIYVTFAKGIYSGSAGTFSTTGGDSSWTKNDGSQPALTPISYAGPWINEASGDLILWTESRNSHESISKITNETAYLQI